MIDTKALRSRILDLAIQGKLTEQLPSDGTAEELYQQIQAEKQALIKEGKIKKEKPLPEISADEIPFEIPSNWKWVRLQAIANSIWAGRDKPDDFVPVKDEFRTIPVVANGVTDEGILGYTATATAPKNSITVAGRGTIGFSVHRIYDYCPIIRLIVIEQSSFIEPKYLQLIMVKFPESSVGSSIPQLTVPMIKPKIIPLPPLAEQKRIVERVEEIFRLLDTIDEAQEKYSADSQILKSKLITAGIQGKLTKQLPSDGTAEELYQRIQAEKQKLIKEGKLKKEKPLPPVSPEEVPFEIPENWMWVRFDEISNIICTGLIRSGKEQYKEAKYYYFKMQNIGNFTGKCNYDDMVMINASQEEFEKTKLEEGDFLFNTRNSAELVGKTAVVHNMPIPNIILNNNILKIQFYGHINPDYINYYFISSVGRKLLYQFVSSTTNVAAIYQRQIVTLPLPLPPLAEQKRIADVLERALGEIG